MTVLADLSPIVPALGAFATMIGLLGAAYFTYRQARRSSSATILSSQAPELWAESKAMRDALQTELAHLRVEMRLIRTERDDAEAREQRCIERLRAVMGAGPDGGETGDDGG